VYLHPGGSTINATDIDTSNNYLYVGGSFSRLYQNNANYHSIYDINSSTFRIKSKNYGTNGIIYAYAFDSVYNILYVGGDFTTVTDNNDITIDANYVAAWSISKQRWRPFGKNKQNGLNTICNALAVDVDNQVLYVGGNFTKMSDAFNIDQSANYVAKWNISRDTWSKLGASDVSYNNGLNTLCRTLVYDSSNRQLYVGGDFTKVRDGRGVDISANRVAIWKPSTVQWSIMGSATQNGINDGSCNALALDSSNQRVYVGGSFTTVKDSSNTSLSANRIAYWNLNTSAWYGLGTTSSTGNGLDSSVNALAFDTSNNRLYVGGNFKKMSDSSKADQSANYVAFWDASNSLWGQLGGTDFSKNGVDASVNALAFDSINNILYVGGNFLKVYDTTFTLASPLKSQYLATWNPSTQRWRQIGYSSSSTASLYGLSNVCRALTYNSFNKLIYVGGDHTSVCDSSNISTDASNIAYVYLTTGSIYPLGTSSYNGTNSIINNIKVDTTNNVVYVDGTFTTVYDSSNRDLSVNYIAKYDISTKTWSRLGSRTSNGLGGMGKALFYDNTNNAVYVSGGFTAVRDSTTDTSKNFNYVAKWDVAKSAWSPLGSYGNGTNGTISAYAYDAANYRVFCGGSFTQVYDNSNTTLYTRNVAVFDMITNTWSVLGASDVSYNNGLNLECRTLTYDASNGQLYVGGDFTSVRDGRGVDISANKIAIWKLSTSRWSVMGTFGQNGTNGQILTYAYDSCKNVMYAGGTFTTVFDTSNIGGLSANRVAKWDLGTFTWSKLTDSSWNGVDGSCNALAMDTSNQELYVGGNFTTVYDSFNTNTLTNTLKVAKWSILTERWSRLGNSTATTNGLTSTSRSTYCSALAYDSANRGLYVGGNFTKVGDAGQADQSLNNVAYWNISTSRWSKLGASDFSYNNGLNLECRTLIYDASNIQLYVGGDFTVVRDSRGPIFANKIAIWKPSLSNWAVMGSIYSNGTYYIPATTGLISNSVYDSCKNVLYVIGNFTHLYDNSNIVLNANNIACWHIKEQCWSRLGTSSSNGITNSIYNFQSSSYGSSFSCLAIDSSRQILYVGSTMTSVNDESGTLSNVNFIASWNINTQRWSRLGGSTSTTNGTSNVCSALAYDSRNNMLHVGGQFTVVYDSAGAKTSYYIASWDVSNNIWKVIGPGVNALNAPVFSMEMDISNNYLWVVGSFYSATDLSGVLTANACAYWNLNNSRWYPFGTRTYNGFTRGINVAVTLKLDSSNNMVYICTGNSIQGGGPISLYDASWSTTPLVGNYMAAYNILTSRWQLLGDSANNGINGNTLRFMPVLALDTSNSILYLSGNFTSTRDSTNTSQSVNYIAAWNIRTQTWSRLGSSASNGITNVDNTESNGGSAMTMSLDSSYNLYVGSVGSYVYDASGILPVNGVAVWKPSRQRWERLGVRISNGVDALCNAMDLDLSKRIISSVDLPVIFEGGIGNIEQITDMIKIGANSFAIGTLITFKDYNIFKIKQYLLNKGYKVRF
jgi:hypothetical protein